MVDVHREVPGARRKERYELIAAASQDFLDKPDQISTINRNLFRALVMNAIPVLHGKTAEGEDVDTWFANSPPEKRLLIARGQRQALRSALAHVVFIELTSDVLPFLERKESLVSSTKKTPEDGAYIGDTTRVLYPGGYHQFMLAGVRWIQQPSFDFVESLRNPEHPYHQLFAATYDVQSAVRSERLEQQNKKARNAYHGIIRDPEDFGSYQPLFLGNLQDVMVSLVAAQKAYITWVDEEDKGPQQPEEIVRFVLANLDTFSLPARMKREAALKRISHPVIRYANRPMEKKPFAFMPPIFAAVGDSGEPRLELAPEFAYLRSADHSFCAGVVAHKSGDPSRREVAERFLSTVGIPSGRPVESPDYGKIDPITILGIIGVHIAKDTIFQESPF